MLSRCIISLIKKIHIQTSEQLDPLTVWKRTIAFSSGRSSTPKAMDESNDQRISIGQMRATNDKDFNKRQVEEIVRRGVADQSCVRLINKPKNRIGRVKVMWYNKW